MAILKWIAIAILLLVALIMVSHWGAVTFPKKGKSEPTVAASTTVYA
jgi:hypothetical protein